MNNKILVFIDWYRPGFKGGGPITSVANLVSHLADNFQFFIITRNTDFGESTPYKGIETDQWIEIKKNVQVCYMSNEHLSRRNIFIHAEDAQCDTWHVNGIYSWFFSIFPLLLARRLAPSKLIVSSRGMLSPHARAVKEVKKTIFIRMARLLNLYRNVTFHVTNKQEAKAIRASLGEMVEVKIAPNLPAHSDNKKGTPIGKEKGSLSLVFLGRISIEKNTLQALKILREIKSGTIDYHLVGEIGDRDYWARCNKMISDLPPNIRVFHGGPIPPEQLPDIMEEMHFLFLPTSGENYGHAILECMSYGLPAIISDLTPWKNLQEHGAGWAISLERVEQFVEVLRECLDMDQETYDTRSRAARQYALGITDDPGIFELNKKLFQYE